MTLNVLLYENKYFESLYNLNPANFMLKYMLDIIFFFNRHVCLSTLALIWITSVKQSAPWPLGQMLSRWL